jgi:hypothetical protein
MNDFDKTWARALVREALWDSRDAMVTDLLSHTCFQRDVVLATILLVDWDEASFTMATLANEYGMLDD